MTSKHTPGPWIVNRHGSVETSEGFAVAKRPDYSSLTDGEGADMALIAASPAMLKALQRIATVASCAPNDDTWIVAQELTRIVNIADAAIAIAEGRA